MLPFRNYVPVNTRCAHLIRVLASASPHTSISTRGPPTLPRRVPAGSGTVPEIPADPPCGNLRPGKLKGFSICAPPPFRDRLAGGQPNDWLKSKDLCNIIDMSSDVLLKLVRYSATLLIYQLTSLHVKF
jgi:hypothetical protein